MGQKLKVSVAIITGNEEANIGDALQSVRDFDDIVVVDSFSTDRTAEICRRYTDRFYLHEWQGYALQKQTAVDYSKNRWVLILDSDERVTPELRSEIEEAIKQNVYAGYFIPRKNFFLGRWIKHGGWSPDLTLRLFDRERARMEPRRVHEKVTADGPTARLKSPLEHHTYRTIAEFVKKMDKYSALAAEEIRAGAKKRYPLLSMFTSPVTVFFKMYFLRLGLLDGVRGLMLAVFYSFYAFLKYSKVWESGEEGCSAADRPDQKVSDKS